MFKPTLILIYVIVLLSGCTAKTTEPTIDFEPPVYVEQMPAREDELQHVSTGSIFGQGDNPLFSDHKAMRVNDLVTVTIVETAQSSNSAKKSLGESDSSTLGGGVFSSGSANAGATNLVGQVNTATDIGFKSNSVSSYSGQGSLSKDASFTTTVSARVVKVLANGNYFIVGSREILIDDEKQIMQLSGVIRPYDIDQNNVINSAQMSDAKILYKSEGDIDRATKQGWGTKLVQAIWPF